MRIEKLSRVLGMGRGGQEGVMQLPKWEQPIFTRGMAMGNLSKEGVIKCDI